MTNLDSVLKSRDITFLTKVCICKAMVFPVVMYGYESWTIKKSEHWRIDAFELWCWRRLLRVPWTARRLNQSILKEINPEYSSEGLMLKLKLPYFGHLMQKAYSLEKTLMLGKTEDRRERGTMEDEMVGWHHWLNRHDFEQAPGDGEGQGSLPYYSPWGRKELDRTERRETTAIKTPALSSEKTLSVFFIIWPDLIPREFSYSFLIFRLRVGWAYTLPILE